MRPCGNVEIYNVEIEEGCRAACLASFFRSSGIAWFPIEASEEEIWKASPGALGFEGKREAEPVVRSFFYFGSP